MNSKRIALVTGANKGLGLETVRQLSKNEVYVILTSRNKENGKLAIAELENEGIKVDFIKLDVTSSIDIQSAKTYVEEKYGRLDILINNAGISKEKSASYMVNTSASVSIETIREVYETNLFGAVNLTQTMLPLLMKSENGIIINLSSELGSIGLHSDSTSQVYHLKKYAYNSSKTALNQFTVHLSEALKDSNIKVYSVSPGWVKTDMGSQYAPLEVPDGTKIIVDVALTGEFPSGLFITHQMKTVPW